MGNFRSRNSKLWNLVSDKITRQTLFNGHIFRKFGRYPIEMSFKLKKAIYLEINFGHNFCAFLKKKKFVKDLVASLPINIF